MKLTTILIAKGVSTGWYVIQASVSILYVAVAFHKKMDTIWKICYIIDRYVFKINDFCIVLKYLWELLKEWLQSYWNEDHVILLEYLLIHRCKY